MDISKNLKGVLLDFDGTIFNLEMDWAGLKETLKRDFGIETYNIMGKQPDVNKKALKTILGAELSGVENGNPLPGALEILTRLSDNFKMAFTSRNCREAIEAGLAKIGFDQPKPIVGREDVEHGKPHPEAIEIALSHLGLKSDQVVLVGDTYHDLEAAHALDVACVIVKNEKQTYSPEGAEHYIDTLHELPALLGAK